MSLAIVFRGPEGIVLAADSRVSLNAQLKGREGVILTATFDNANKIMKVYGQDYVGAVTYGLGAISETAPRTPHSYLPEFEEQLLRDKAGRLSVESFAQKISDFFMERWKAAEMPDPYSGEPIIFLVGGFDENSPYGKVYEVAIPHRPSPVRQGEIGGSGQFGITWGGQREFTDRLLQGFDPKAMSVLKSHLGLDDAKLMALYHHLKANLSVPIPYQFLPLQDCVDMSIFLIRTTLTLQNWIVGFRGVGGSIDVGVITRTEGFKWIQRKEIRGEAFRQ